MAQSPLNPSLNGRFLVWNGNGMEENRQYGIWKHRLPFHSIYHALAPGAINLIVTSKI